MLIAIVDNLQKRGSIAEIYFDCGTELEAAAPSPRLDGIIVSVSDQSVTPLITIRSRREFAFDSTSGILKTNGLPYLHSRPRAISGVKIGDHWVLELPKGTTHAEIIVIHGGKGREAIRRVPNLQQQMQRGKNYWRNEAAIPRNKIFVPDSGIQYLLDANTRNLYQVREIVDSHLQFQPGPTVYRGLWLGDVMPSGIPVMMLGDTSSLRRFLANGMHYQLPNGQLRVMYPTLALNETPIFLRQMQKLNFISENGESLPEVMNGVWGKPVKVNFRKQE